ncbi:Transglutaminase-like superfamily protein [Lachnospiraceae bacterium C7]|nr:Transglutaminase-like superfamily protein [Lachnospiraceae bacterium C7]
MEGNNYTIHRTRRIGLVLLAVISAMLLVLFTQSHKVKAAPNEAGYKQPTFEKVDQLEDVVEQGEIDQNVYNQYNAYYTANPYWVKYGSRYYYNQMTTAEKTFYNALYARCDAILNSTENCKILSSAYTVGTVFYNLGSFSEDPTEDAKIANEVALIFSLENPQFYFLNSGFTYGQYGTTQGFVAPNVYSAYVNGNTRSNVTAQFKAQLESWKNQASGYPTRMQRLRKLETLIDENVTYVSNDKDQSAVSAVLDKKSVCTGYAKTFEMISNAMGIDAVNVTSATHQWTLVKIGSKWYNVDATWDDDGTNDGVASGMSYFLVSDDNVKVNDQNGLHILESRWEANGVATVPTSSENYLDDIFSVSYYKNKYRDLYNAYRECEGAYLDHFVNFGMNEKRIASDKFNVNVYMGNYEDLRNAFGTRYASYYEHYITNGKDEGRDPLTVIDSAKVKKYNGVDYSLVYDPDYYMEHNPDVVAAFGNDYTAILRHFVDYGMREKRKGNSTFNVISYKNRYADLRNAYGNDLSKYYLHYINYGNKENRVTTGYENTIVNPRTVLNGVDYGLVFDANYYVNRYKDLYKAFGYDDEALLRHFVNYGMNEGRQASEKFDVAVYRSNYVDLRRAYGKDLKKYYIHYLNYGHREGREAA